MQFVKYYYEKVIRYDLINKFTYNSFNELPRLKKITLSFDCKGLSLQKISTILFSLELITTKKGSIGVSKKANVFLKLQKGSPASCKVVLSKNVMYDFLAKLLVEIFPKVKNLSELKINIINKNTFFYKFISNSIVLTELQEQYPLFNNLPELTVTFTTTTTNKKELLFLIKSFQLPNN